MNVRDQTMLGTMNVGDIEPTRLLLDLRRYFVKVHFGPKR
jgi:hypothetical protein